MNPLGGQKQAVYIDEGYREDDKYFYIGTMVYNKQWYQPVRVTPLST